MARAEFLDLCADRWPDKLARLRGGFYTIKDKAGKEIPFVMNEDQERFMAERHGLDIVLKARQKGFTTVIQLDMLDDCLFKPNTSAGVIAHNLGDNERTTHAGWACVSQRHCWVLVDGGRVRELVAVAGFDRDGVSIRGTAQLV